jgi:hypothetical protein
LTKLAHDLVGLGVLFLVIHPVLFLLIHLAAISHYHHHPAACSLILLHLLHQPSWILIRRFLFILLLLLVFTLLLGTSSCCARFRCSGLLRLPPSGDWLLNVVDELLKVLLPELLLRVGTLLCGLGGLGT